MALISCTLLILTVPSVAAPVNSEAIKNIINNSNVKIQLGGGIRDMQSIESWLNCGVSKVIIGTAALKNQN